MKKLHLQAIIEFIKEEEKNFDFNDYVLNYVKVEDIKECKDSIDVKELFEKANEDEEITRADVIYYANAIEYLKENDQSLNESIEIAKEYGYELDSINSELLASLLQSRNNLEDYNTFLNNLESFIYNFLS